MRCRRRQWRMAGWSAVAGLIAVTGVACEPAPPPDGRDLGVTVDGPLPAVVPKGQQIAITGTITNHGSVPASGVTVTYLIDTGFVVDDLVVDVGAACTAPNDHAATCLLDGPLAPLATVTFVAHATAGTVSGGQTHLLAVGSPGTEPAEDPNPNHLTFATSVGPAAPEPVSIGGTRNSLGTGSLVGAALPGAPSDGYVLAVNPYCTDKVNGDRFQSGYVNGACSGTVNTEYRSAGYTYAIDVPDGRTSPLRVLLWDARYNDDSYGIGPEAAIDSFRQPGDDTYTFSLYAADATPQDDTDNPLLCARTFVVDTPFDLTFLGSQRWNELCAIGTFQPSGRYLLRVHNQGEITVPKADGSNAFGLAAVYASQGLDPAAALCDRTLDPQCPVVSGPGEASMSIRAETSVARVPVGPVAAVPEGRRLVLRLFDPGEGGQYIRVLAPTGPNSWTPATVQWSTENGLSGSGSQINVTQSRFNGHLLTITVDLAGYVPPEGNEQWQVEYQFVGTDVTDRTTWQAAIEDVPTP